MRAILLVSHGSHSPKTKTEVEALVDQLRRRNIADCVEYAFLEIETPSIPEGIHSLVRQGATHVQILLNFLNSGKHVDVDIPRIVKESQKEFPHVKFLISQPVGQHSKIVDLFCELAKASHAS